MIINNNIEKKVDIETKCPRCGKKISNYTCDFCGYKLKEEKALILESQKIFSDSTNDQAEYYALCPDCGMQVFNDEQKCPNCGCNLDWNVEELKTNKTSCFCCGEYIDKNTEICPKCGANLTQLDISESRNPYTKKYLMRDGSVMEGNGWYIGGAIALVAGIMFFLYFITFGADTFSIVTSVVIAGIGVLLTMIGSYRKHKGKTIVRKENDKIRETNPDFKTDEDTEDVWDKIKKLTKKEQPIYNIANNSENKLNQLSMHEELRNLKSLLDENILTQSEFDEAKKAILEKYQKNINQ